MRIKNYFFRTLVLLGAFSLLFACTSMDQGEAGTSGKAKRSSAEVSQAYWDAANKAILLTFPTNEGALEAAVVATDGQTVYKSTIDSAVADQTIDLKQVPAGDYTLSLSNAAGQQTSLQFTVL